MLPAWPHRPTASAVLAAMMVAWCRAQAQEASAPAAPSSAAAGAAAPSSAAPCSGPEHRAFDFWLGEWTVTTPDGKEAGRSTITAVAGGCALHENWRGRGGFSGQSLNAWNARLRRWQQTWLDSSGGRLDLIGGRVGDDMVLEGEEPHDAKPGIAVHHRITWSPRADGSVRQLWQQSEDGKRSWSVAFDGRYVRRR